MYNCNSAIRVALLGSVLALAALAPAMGADLSRADWERIRAVTGEHKSASPKASGAAAVAYAPVKYKLLHSFAGGAGDGQNPTAEVTLDGKGNIYGVTDFGGTYGNGALFEMTKSGTVSLLHSFGGIGDGISPDGAVIFDANGNMYGTTETGGSTSNGTIWEFASDGTYKVLHSFAANEGDFIRGRLVRDANGNLYGTALFGGANKDGTVFELGTDGTLTILHAFAGTDGVYPEHGVVSDSAGNLYGVTAFGGTLGNGAIYEIAADGTFTTLHSFTGGTDGGFPYGGLTVDSNGNLYGSAADGGAYSSGTAFELPAGGTLTTLYSFSGGYDGSNPEGDMLRIGNNLYSTASYGGDHGYGVVYELEPKGKLKVLETFDGTNGGLYSGGLVASGKSFYGTTEYGGANGGAVGDGVVFKLTKK